MRDIATAPHAAPRVAPVPDMALQNSEPVFEPISIGNHDAFYADTACGIRVECVEAETGQWFVFLTRRGVVVACPWPRLSCGLALITALDEAAKIAKYLTKESTHE
jgi:hypothetical protein